MIQNVGAQHAAPGEIKGEILKKASQIKLVVFDVDGVLTDGRLYFNANGEELKVFHVRDGLGIQLLLKNNIEVAVISGRNSPIVERRLTQLGIKHIHQGKDNKLPILENLRSELKIELEHIAYVGDDVLDIPIIKQVGLGIAVADANPVVKQYAVWQTTQNGGYGAAREICDFILQAQDKLERSYQDFIN